MRLDSRNRAVRAAMGVACVSALALGVGIQTASASSGPRAAVVHTYLALGDSVSFGYEEPTVVPAPNYLDATSFVGFPEDVGAALGLSVANAACPGETSLSAVQAGVQSNGCENSPGGGPGYRSAYPLHVSYKGTQLAYATTYLKSHTHTSLVTLMIGANDYFLCQETTADKCSSEVVSVISSVTKNVGTILSTIRTKDHYKGQIILEDYYSLDYSNAAQTALVQELNSVVGAAAKKYNVQVADGFGEFKTASAHSGGNPCTAGLLTQLSGGGCGIHPSYAGAALLALAVEKVVKH